jgi:cell wall-associated NlpC family hydrolase
MKRLHYLLIALLCLGTFPAKSQLKSKPKDQEILSRIFDQLNNEKNKSTAQLVVLTGKCLIGTPYVAHTLEMAPEQLVVNLRGLDCTTYVENCLAIARTLKSEEANFDKFTKELIKIRYRDGVIVSYPSRLHYFSDWIYENDTKGFVKDVSKEIGNIPYPPAVNFMSTHSDSYQQLKNNTAFVAQLADKEKEISARTMYYLPKDKLPLFENKLQEGDIIGITTSVSGLDITHVGIVVKQNGRVHFMHASSKAERVIISETTLIDYLARNKLATGIMVVRPN